MEAAGINWETVQDNLPFDSSEESQARREEMWSLFNVNDNKYLLAQEVENGIMDMCQAEYDKFDCHKAVIDAFAWVKLSTQVSPDESTQDMIKLKQFRLLLRAINQIYAYYQIFNWIDETGEFTVNKESFVSKKEEMEEWTGPIEDVQSEFDKLDRAKEEVIPFVDVMYWALDKNLEKEGDRQHFMEDDESYE